MINEKKVSGALTWNGPDYAHVSPGIYSAVAIRIQGPEWLVMYRRWSVIVEFELLGESDQVRVAGFFNMGGARIAPKIGRQSRYFKAWTIANGELPRRGQKMDPNVFCDGQVFRIEVEDSLNDSDARKKSSAEVYSRVKQVLSAEWPRSNPLIMNQESLNHSIK